MVEDHEGARRPQDGKDGGDGQEDGGGLAGRVATETEATAAPAQLAHNDSVEGEEDGAGEEIDGGTVGPHQDVLGHGSPVALSSPTTTTVHPCQAVPQLRPPVIRSCREQAANIHGKYHLSRARRVGHGVVAQWMANGDISVDGEGHGDPDGGVNGGELQDLHCTV